MLLTKNDKILFDPYLLDLSKYTNRKIVTSDIHGCFDELQELLTKVNYKEGEDILVFGGDLIDRASKINEVLKFAMETPLVFTVMSNHENKYLRYLRGNKVNATTLQKTIEQVTIDLQELRFWLEDLPYMIKLSEKEYVVHAGINPNVPILRQNKETLLYARTFNPETNSVVEIGQSPWYDFLPKTDCIIYFGHQVSEVYNVSPWAKALDGGCCFGGKLRAVVMDPEAHKHGLVELVEVDSKTNVAEKHTEEYGCHHSLVPFETLVTEKYLSKSEKGDLVLYKYTDKCTFEKKWNEITRQARGIIFNRLTGEIVARPFKKFFNLNEAEETFERNLPNQHYEIFDKLDGSLGVIYFYKDRWNISTAGSFFSDQAAYAANLLRKCNLTFLNPAYTYLAEIIYPENKIVCNYQGREELVLLAAINTQYGMELGHADLAYVAEKTGMAIVKKYSDLDLTNAISSKATIPKDIEGYVIRFENGLRLKIKGDEYLRLHRIVSSLTPLNIWKAMKQGKLPIEFKAEIPEELLPDVDLLEKKLNIQYSDIDTVVRAVIRDQLGPNFDFFLWNILPFEITPEIRKRVGLLLTDKKIPHKGAFFPYILGDLEGREKYIMNLIRPVGNFIV